MTTVFGVGFALCAFGCPASAAPEGEDVWAAHRLSIDGEPGFGAPTGVIGTSVELSISRAFAVRAGIGYDRSISFSSASDQRGLQWAVMPTLRAPLGHGDRE